MNIERFLDNKKRDEMLAMYLLKNKGIPELSEPILDGVVLYFKDRKLIFTANIESTKPKITVKVLNEALTMALGFPLTQIRDLDCMEYDFIIYSEQINPKVCDPLIKDFFDIYEDNDRQTELHYWDDDKFYENR
jgi:hypothetical protein